MTAVRLLPGIKGLPLLAQRTVTRTIMLQESIGKGFPKDAFTPRKQEVILRKGYPHSQEPMEYLPKPKTLEHK
ncbi:hypothetical protein STEG23_016737, partial [Scotinomys teguina]